MSRHGRFYSEYADVRCRVWSARRVRRATAMLPRPVYQLNVYGRTYRAAEPTSMAVTLTIVLSVVSL